MIKSKFFKSLYLVTVGAAFASLSACNPSAPATGGAAAAAAGKPVASGAAVGAASAAAAVAKIEHPEQPRPATYDANLVPAKSANSVSINLGGPSAAAAPATAKKATGK